MRVVTMLYMMETNIEVVSIQSRRLFEGLRRRTIQRDLGLFFRDRAAASLEARARELAIDSAHVVGRRLEVEARSIAISESNSSDAQTKHLNLSRLAPKTKPINTIFDF